ncbi:MAG: YihY/virulence factor BrkB family protein [bacterium]|nr:YihY/virulence factor BrkB family protein [bacterium]
MKWRLNIKNKIKKVGSGILGLCRFSIIIQRRFTYEHGGVLLAGSLSFYLIVSIVPLLLVVTTIFTSIAQSSDIVYNAIIDFFEVWTPAVTQPAISLLNGFMQGRISVGIISVVFLLWSAGLFLDATIQAIDRIWNVKERWSFWKRKLLSLLVIPIFIIAFGISFGFTAFISFMHTLNIELMGRNISGISWLWGGVGIFVSLVITVVFLFWFYKVVPHVPVSSRSALIGALFAGCSWEIAKYVFDWYIARFTGFNRIYGNLGGVFIGLLWMYYTAIIILLGAELAGYYEERKNTNMFAKPK